MRMHIYSSSPAAAAEEAVVPDRRRAGRRDFSNPALIALLREEGDPMEKDIDLPTYSPPARGGEMLPVVVAIVAFWALCAIAVSVRF
jgi:hypothetical protein